MHCGTRCAGKHGAEEDNADYEGTTMSIVVLDLFEDCLSKLMPVQES